ncbi:MAG: LPS assembly lipoprotein LptE [Nitrospirota bacterium]|nr:LPS assembly lipoprotein LptE [Nitrospirota bacterium]
MKGLVKYAMVFLATAFISGCGYHVAGSGKLIPGNIKSIAMPIFQNLTTKPDIESIITGAFRNEFINNIEISDKGEAVFNGAIRAYTLKAVSFTRSDVNQEYRLTIIIAASITKAGVPEPLWADDNIVAYQDFIVNVNDVSATKDAERNALSKVSQDMARLTKERIVEGF